MPYIIAFAWGAGASLLALALSAFFFWDHLLPAATGLTAVALIFEMNMFLDENRDAIWLEHRSPWIANLVLAWKVVSVFLGVFTVSLLCQALFPTQFFLPVAPKGPLFNNQALPLFLHNLRVLMGGFLLAFIYRSAGILLVISWNGINWATSILSSIQFAGEQGIHHAWFFSLAVLPHLILEAAAYVTAGMSGVFLSKALFKYRLSSWKFFRVSRAVVVILMLSVGCLWLAMESEVRFAQGVLMQLKK